ncbi:MAG: 4-hydroxy-3-methylbut-2-enyl diphosphate reductase [Nanoarchaeota archaeon]
MVKKILLAQPRGFCAGVERAIHTVENAITVFGKPIYVRHHIVHNAHVVRGLEEKGAVFVEDLGDVPAGSVVILSAHGSPQEIKEEAKKRMLNAIDAVCPLVTKVHFEAIRFHKQGYTIFLIGHEGHQEVIGTMSYAPMILVRNIDDAHTVHISNSEKIAVLTQTTLSIDDTKDILDVLKKRFPHVLIPAQKDICYATTNRQNAIKEMVKECDLFLVIGSPHSSNSNSLVETAKKGGVPAYLVEDCTAVKDEWLVDAGTIGLTLGASAPETLALDLIHYLLQKDASIRVETRSFTQEEYTFQLPKELRRNE